MNNRRKIRRRPKSQTYINVAPLVDVMLVLMVIFMMTSQISTVGIQVDLPKTTSKNIDSNDTPIVISVDKNSKIYIEEASVTLDELLQKLPAILKCSKSDVVYIKGDKNLNYGRLMEIMGIISNSGGCKVSLLAEAQTTR